MDYKVKLAAVRRFQSAIGTVISRYYADDVGHIRHTPKVYYRVLKRNLREQGIRFKRSDLLRFAKLAFVLEHCEKMDRRQVELIFYQLLTYNFLVEMLFAGFKVSAGAVKKAIILCFSLASILFWALGMLFSRLFNRKIYLTNAKFLI